MAVAAPVVALAGGFALGAPAWSLAAAAVAWALAAWRPGLPRLVLAVMAPMLLTAGLPVATLLSWQSAAAAAIVAASCVPLVTALGPGRPPAAAFAVMAVAFAVPAALAFTPWGATLAGSDIATGSSVLAVAATLLVAASVAAVRARNA